jgi:Leucine-rich repeat (LRR) protein
MNYPEARRWQFDCRSFLQSDEKRAFLEAIDHGYVVTGGGALAWYSLRPWVLNLTEVGFVPGPDWELLMERTAPVKSWRTEPLRVWRVRDALERVVVDIADARFESCLRARVAPLRPEDGLGRDQPITVRLARHVTNVECADADIGDATGLDAFVNTTVLNLAGNALTSIDVGALTKLEVLILGINALERVTGLSRLESLRLLWLGRNRLETVDVSGLRNLEDLRLDGNRLTSLHGLGDSVRLNTIFLGENPGLDCAALGLPRELLAQSGCQG